MLESLTPAQPITLTLNKVPAREDARQTVERLMRQAPEIKSALKRTQEHRARVTITRSRGKRPWTMRHRRTRVAVASAGASWTMPYLPALRRDIESVAEFLTITPA